MTQSVYQRVLGPRFADLDPHLGSYFSALEPGTVGRGSGVYDVAGSAQRWLVPVLVLLGWRRILFPEFGRDIPFDIENTPGPDGGLSAVRVTHFATRDRVMEDTMRVIDGRLHDFLGRRRGLEVRFVVSVASGALVMHSDRAWLHLGPVRLWLPALLSASVDLTEQWDGDAQRVTVRMRHPLFGTVFEYGGRFAYRVERG
jgi:hypothetical protein